MSEPTTTMTIEHDDGDHGAFFVRGTPPRAARVAEMVYRRHAPDHVTVVHTEVDASLRGLGVARRLLDALVVWARATGTRVSATCPYAKAQFDKDLSIQDVYVA